MALEIEQFVTPFIQSQFPEFYNTDGPTFISFVKAYYSFIDQGGSESRNILSYSDIDTTVNNFISYFKSEYLSGLPATTAANTSILVKHIQDLYKSKGNPDSVKLLFNLVFGTDSEIYNPGTDVLKPSDGIWTVPVYLECSISDRTTGFVGSNITGSISGATAFVEDVNRLTINGVLVDVVYISNLIGNFETGENITNDNNLLNSPTITGSLNNIFITEGGANNSIGDVFNITGSTGVGGQAVVRSTIDGTGKVAFTIVDPGYGYESNSTIIVSNSVIGIVSANASIPPFSYVIQPLQSINYKNLPNTYTITLLQQVQGWNSSNTLVANGYIVSVSTSNTDKTSGNLVISTTAGLWNQANGTIVLLSSNGNVNATINTYSNVSAYGTIVGSNSTFLGLYNTSGTFYQNGYLNVYIQQPIGLSTGNTSSNSIIGTGNNAYLLDVSNGDILYFRANGDYIGTVSNVNSNTSISIASNSALSFTNTMVFHTKMIASVNTGSIYNSGTGATFNIGTLSNTETITYESDLISSNNNTNICFLDLAINTASYGFTANTSLGYGSTNPIYQYLTPNTITIGSILSLNSINPGSNYNAPPFVAIVSKSTAPFGYFDDQFILANTNYSFSNGQYITQQQSVNTTILTMSTNTGSFTIGEGIIQSVTGAKGVILSTTVNTLDVSVLSGNTFVSSNTITGQQSGATANISSANSYNYNITVKGLIKSVEANTINVRRESFNNDFLSGTVVSQDSTGSTIGIGYIQSIVPDQTWMGFDAAINTAVTTANGIATQLQILSSGYGYTPNSSIELISVTNSSALPIYGSALVERQGLGSGYWKNTNGQLDSNKYIHDNYYYQEFSYEVQSVLSLNQYSDILKRLLHVSGTQMFGKAIIKSEMLITPNTPELVINGIDQ